jgi:uncharacterized membrane protein
VGQYDVDVSSSLIHLYRGEVGRMTSYRIRLDTTTNWAVLIAAGVATFALGQETISHSVILLAMAFTFYFMYVEARRFQVYEIAHQRVRLLEKYFYHEMLGKADDQEWHREMLDSLANSRSPLTRLEALAWRLRRNYLGIHIGLALVWLWKLSMGGTLEPREFVALAATGPVPGELMVLGMAAYIVALSVVAAVAKFSAPMTLD